MDPPPVPEAVTAEYTRRIYALAELKPDTNDFDEDAPHVLRLMPEAREELLSFMARLEPRLAEGADLCHLSDWAGKLAGAVARISGLLHLAEHWTGLSQPMEVAADTVTTALRIGEYLILHRRVSGEWMQWYYFWYYPLPNGLATWNGSLLTYFSIDVYLVGDTGLEPVTSCL